MSGAALHEAAPAASGDGVPPWWTPPLRLAALRRPPAALSMAALPGFPLAAWLAAALGPVRVRGAEAAPSLRRLLDRAGLAETDAAGPVLWLGAPAAGEDPPPEGIWLVDSVAEADWPALRARFGDGLRLGAAGGLALLARPDAAPAPVAALLREARDPAGAASLAQLFATLGERLALEARLAADRQEAQAARQALERRLEAAEARAAATLLRLQAIEGSTVWRAARLLRRGLERHPRLLRTLRWAARLAWRTVLRPLVGPAGLPAAAAAPRTEATIHVPGAGSFVLARAAAVPATAALRGAEGVRIAAVAPPAAAPVGRLGFGAFFPHAGPPPRDATLELAGGATQPLPPATTAAPLVAIRDLLGRLGDRPEVFAPLLREQILPAVAAFWAVRRAEPCDTVEETLGTPPAAPEVSIIVPLHGRMDFLLHQVAAFSNDPDLLARAELIYVVDDPPAADAARAFARRAHLVYGVPLRLLLLSRNRGYSGANNAGARIARAPHLLLLNSDVLPLGPGWLGPMLAAAREELPECGALGCRLLFEDGTLQHAGMAFFPYPALGEAWRCDHPFKGEPAEWDEPALPREVPAVTGACLMVPRALYESVGGLSEDYVIGDFEDADLCHRIAARGLRIWYDPRVALLHLERQSIALLGDPGWRHALTLCNMLRHAAAWAPRLRVLAPVEGSA